MKKLLVALCLTCALALSAAAAEKGKKSRKPMTDEQKTVHKEMLGKYDADKDGKLSKEERGKISAEDKEKMKKAGFGQRKKESETK